MSFIYRVLRYLRFRLFGLTKPLSASECRFIDMNERFWAVYEKNAASDDVAGGVIFVHYELYPTSLLGMLTIACARAYEKGLKVVVIAPSFLNRTVNKVLRSYPRLLLEYEDKPEYLYLRLRSLVTAIIHATDIRSPEQLLAFRHDGIQIGDVLYDAILADGVASISKINYWQIVGALGTYYYQDARTKHILQKYNVVCGEAVHIVGAPGAAFLRNMLTRAKPVYICAAGIKKYRELRMMHECWETPDPRYIKWMLANKEDFIPLAESALLKRLGDGRMQHYSVSKRIYRDRSEFCGKFGLDADKKNVFVMLHAFNDWPHTYGEMIYLDFYQWFSDVLALAKRTNNVNWIFKNHPYAKYYKTDVDVDELFRSVDFPNIRYMSDDVDFNTSSIRSVGDVVITCLGTAGLEYSAFGIPCILAARNWYSGLGFTIEPKSIDEYRHTLENLDQLNRLNDVQIATAKIMAYFSFGVMNANNIPDPLKLHASHDMDQLKQLSSDGLLDLIVSAREAIDAPVARAYLDEINRFLDDEVLYQYVDFGLHALDFRRVAEMATPE